MAGSLKTRLIMGSSDLKSAAYQAAAGNACPQASQPDELQIFNAFTSIYRKHEAAIGRHVAQFEDIRAEIAEKREKGFLN